jgi:signal transduction histidine kinase/GAF domain-containing protein
LAVLGPASSSGRAEVIYYQGPEIPGWERGADIATAGSIAGKAMATQELVAVADMTGPGFADEFPGEAGHVNAGLRSGLAAPLVFEGEPAGALVLMAAVPGAYGESQISAVLAAAAGAAHQIGSARLLTRMRRESDESAALADAGRLAGSSTDLSAAFPSIASRLGDVLPFDRMTVATLDATGQKLTIECSFGLAVPERVAAGNYPATGSLAAYVAASRATVTAGDIEREGLVSRFPSLSLLQGAGIRSVLIVPMLSGDKVAGAMAIASVKADAYGEREVSFAERTAVQLAGPVANRAVLRAMKAQSAEAEALAEIGRVITGTPRTEAVFAVFADQVRRLVAFDRMVIAVVDQANDAVEIKHVSGREVAGRQAGQRTRYRGSLQERIVMSGKTCRLSDPELAGYDLADAWRSTGLKVIMVAPLAAGGKTYGTLSLASAVEGAFGERDLRLTEQVAAQIAGAVANSALHERAEQEAAERAALAEIGRVISSSRDISEVFEEFVRQVRGLMPVDRTGISVIRPDTYRAQLRYVWGVDIPARQTGMLLPVSGTSLEENISTMQVVVANESNIEELARKYSNVRDDIAAGLRSLMSVPLVAGNRVIGVMGLLAKQPDAYGPREVALAREVAAQIAGVVVNAELREAAQREAAEKSALAEIGRVISSSRGITEVYEEFARQVTKLLPADRLGVSVLRPGGKACDLKYVWGAVVPSRPAGKAIALAGTPLLESLETQRVVVVDDEYIRAKGAATPSLQDDKASGLNSMMCAPLVSQDRVIGFLTVLSQQHNAYGRREAESVERVAAQVAGAVVNAELREAAQREAAERATIAEIGRIVTSSLRIEDVYQKFLEQAAKLLPFDRAVIAMIDDETGVTEDAYVAGVAVEGYSSGGRHAIASPHYEMMRARQGCLAFDHAQMRVMAQTMPSMAKSLAAGLRSMMMAPLIWQDRLVGSLNFRSKEEAPYGPRELALGMEISAQIAGAVATARLYAEEKAQAELGASLARLSLAASRDLSLEDALAGVADEMASLLPYERMSVTLREGEGRELRLVLARGIQIPGKPVGAVFDAARPGWDVLIDPDLSQCEDREVLIGLGLRSRVEAPLGAAGKEPIGYLGLWRTREAAFGQAEAAVLRRAATQLTPGIQNALVHQRTLQLAEAREEAARLEAKAEELSKVSAAKSMFLSTVSHELRTPLTSVIAFTDLMARNRDGALNDAHLRSLEVVRRNARRLGALINDLLDLSRIEAGRLETVRKQFDIAELVKGVGESHSVVLAGKNQRLTTRVPAGSVDVTGDRDRVMQVLWNLLGNASKFSPNGSPVELTLTADEQYATISVKDSGTGITREDQVHLFTPFFRADNTTTRAVGGTGLGLAIVKRLVEMHGGTIKVQSEPGKGSEFTVRLPRNVAEDVAA